MATDPKSAQQYGDGSNSTVGTQLRTDYYQKKALIEAAKESYFGQMADTTSMPKNMGKTIKRYHYLPLLDDANINDQGIDATGANGNFKATVIIALPSAGNLPGDVDSANPEGGNGLRFEYAIAEGASAAAAYSAVIVANGPAQSILTQAGFWDTNYATSVAAVIAAGGAVTSQANSEAAAVPQSGNLYGSSKDVGTINGKMPVLSETGGRVNRVGFKRVELTGEIAKFGFFDEYTQESLDFDTDEELEMHINREMVKGANEITEDALQIDLLNSAGVVRFGGSATSTAEITGEGGDISLIDFEDLMRLSIDLDDNRCPKNTKIITGSRMIDTVTVDSARYMYIGNELLPQIKKMTDTFSDKAFLPIQKYANAGTVARGEVGTIDQFRMIVVPEMMHWASEGADATGANAGYRETNGKYDVFPMLVVGDQSFTTIGFQTDGQTVKFKIKHSKPGSDTSYSADDPYGEMGFMSIKWYYGFMALRPERLAVVKTVAEW
jgi:N4-gp56 family major capsid protein